MVPVSNVETLFETKSIAEVREIQAKTNHAIEEKKKQLRQEVGNSYRDLILSADTIVELADQSQQLSGLVDGIGSRLRALSDDVGARRKDSQGTIDSSSLDRLFILGSRIKYLIDTPETIWGCLDAQDFLTAAQRYVEAGEVYKAFSTRSKQIAHRFPLLQHQWPLVKKLGTTVWDRAAEWLTAQGGSRSPQLASTLAALALLKPIDGAEALKMYFTSRQRYILSCLADAQTSSETIDAETLTALLSDVACMLCTTIAQCGELFLPFPGVSTRPLLLRAAAPDDIVASELMFDADGQDAVEATAVVAQRQTVADRLSSLSAAGVVMEASRWLEVTTKEAVPLVTQLLGACSSASQLLSLEAAVKTSLQEWTYSVSDDSNGSNNTITLGWNDVCQWVLGQPSSLWPLLMEEPWMHHGRQLISTAFTRVEEEAREMAAAAISETESLPAAVAGEIEIGDCGVIVPLGPATPEPTQAAGNRKRRRPGSHKQDVEGSSVLPWLGHAESTVKQINTRLHEALVEAVNICQPLALQQLKTDGSTTAGVVTADPILAARAASLEPFVQDKCVSGVEGVARVLEQLLTKSGSETHAHAALIIGRIAAGLAEGSTPLKVLLGTPTSWAAYAFSGKEGSATQAATAHPRLAQVQRHLRKVGVEAYDVWATWASSGLSQRLINDLASDCALRSDASQRGWEEVVVSGPDGDDMRFPLPSAPSPAAMAVALGACAEVDRAGGHAAHEAALSLLRYKLGMQVASVLVAAAKPSGPLCGLNERGALQLLFDGRFLLKSVLSGAIPPPPSGDLKDATSAAASISAMKREASQLEAEYSSQIDPIDWATYESHLESNVCKFATRSRVLLGALRTTTAGSATETAAASGQPAESNVLRMAPTGSRFAYLPVNTPSLLKMPSGKELLKAQRQDALQLSTPIASLSGDPSSHYSFASLSVDSGAKAKRAALDHAGMASAAGSSSAFVGRLGSLLGDKAAEAAASVSEFSLGGLSGGSLLSSLNFGSKARR